VVLFSIYHLTKTLVSCCLKQRYLTLECRLGIFFEFQPGAARSWKPSRALSKTYEVRLHCFSCPWECTHGQTSSKQGKYEFSAMSRLGQRWLHLMPLVWALLAVATQKDTELYLCDNDNKDSNCNATQSWSH